MQADGARYASTFGAFRSLAVSEGISGLFAGVVPHVLRGGVITSSQVACYDIVKTEVKAAVGLDEEKSWLEGVALHFCSSLVAGQSVCSYVTLTLTLILAFIDIGIPLFWHWQDWLPQLQVVLSML